ncbi:glutathione peroxidase [Maribacter algarum]|uniref:Glutathione peroxidase n=1 Tax=Maribacter algarum (ex Zhang et al. 2020) TaxID=2578118 RepID=A0A5S3PWC3_9FLAO|nr:glutathione peroxidase [Maribacter algarum]TMM59326.1 glutathione peroxidase [Maribacter algarum]
MKFLEKLKFTPSSNTQKTESLTNRSSIYSIVINGLDGRPIDLSNFKGKYILFVNVASKCGFTPQYKDLQQLQNQFEDQLVVIGSPCNQFAGQEPGQAENIQSFCERNFGVTFPLTEKLKVKGSEKHPLYSWLTKKEYNGKKNSSVKWNFQKYLVNPEGELVDFFYSTTKPNSSKITKHIN